MISNRNSFKLAMSLLIFCLIIAPAMIFSTSKPVSAQRRSSRTASIVQAVNQQSTDLQQTDKPQRLFAPHWTTEGGFQTTVYIRNVRINRAVTTKLSLVLNHRTITLPPIHIDPAQTISIDLAKALLDNGEMVAQSGGATIDFEAEAAGQVSAFAHMLNTGQSLTFSFPFAPDGASTLGPLEAVAWYYSKNTAASIALQNTTEKTVIALPTLFASGRKIALGKKALKAHEATVVNLPALELATTTEGPQAAGVRVESSGGPGAVVAQGWVIDQGMGFSAPFTFHHKSCCNCADNLHHQYGAGIMIAAGGMASDAIFSPHLLLRNSSGSHLSVNPVFSFAADHKPVSITLPKAILGPEETTVMNLRKYQEEGLIPSSVEMGNIDVQWKGEPGALVAELASVDQNATFVSPVPLTCNGNPDQHMVFWRTDGDWHSSITIENIAAEDAEMEITISYPGGIYVVDQNIAAHQTIMVSINELQGSQVPDSAGRRIPADATMGGVNIWSRDGKGGLITNAMLVNPVTRTCGSCNGDGYVTAASPMEVYQDCQTVSGFEPHAVGDQFGMIIVLAWVSGHRNCDSPNYATVNSGSPSVVTVNGANLVCVGPGSSYITGLTAGQWPTDYSCACHAVFANGLFPQVIQAKLKQDGTDITGTTRDVIVGQQINLAVEILPTGTATTNKQWTIPDKKIANYAVQFTNENSPTSGMVTPLTNLTSTSVIYYWVDGADGRNVKFSFKVSGKPFTVQATFNVKRPTATFTSTSVANVTAGVVYGSNALSYGNFLPPGPAGLTFTVSNLIIPAGFAGTTELVQMVNSTTRTKLKTTATRLTLSGAGVLDTTFPYGLNYDSPAQPFDFDDLQVTANDSFTMYLIFKPSLANSIWVPLRKINWSWAGDALQSGTLNSGSHSPSQTGIDATDHPQWSANVKSLMFH